jgi:hypothetical protein
MNAINRQGLWHEIANIPCIKPVSFGAGEAGDGREWRHLESSLFDRLACSFETED